MIIIYIIFESTNGTNIYLGNNNSNIIPNSNYDNSIGGTQFILVEANTDFTSVNVLYRVNGLDISASEKMNDILFENDGDILLKLRVVSSLPPAPGVGDYNLGTHYINLDTNGNLICERIYNNGLTSDICDDCQTVNLIPNTETNGYFEIKPTFYWTNGGFSDPINQVSRNTFSVLDNNFVLLNKSPKLIVKPYNVAITNDTYIVGCGKYRQQWEQVRLRKSNLQRLWSPKSEWIEDYWNIDDRLDLVQDYEITETSLKRFANYDGNPRKSYNSTDIDFYGTDFPTGTHTVFYEKPTIAPNGILLTPQSGITHQSKKISVSGTSLIDSDEYDLVLELNASDDVTNLPNNRLPSNYFIGAEPTNWSIWPNPIASNYDTETNYADMYDLGNVKQDSDSNLYRYYSL